MLIEVLNLYFAQARFYDPQTKGFTQEDPIKDGLNWYSYVENNPIMCIDPWGLKAGDIFSSMDDAAEDWGYEYYGASEYIYLECSSWFYSVYDKNGKFLGYSYTEAIVGSPHSATGFWDGKDLISEGGVANGYIHTHPNAGTNFSKSDKDITKDNRLTAYVVAPGASGGIDIRKVQYTIRGFKETAVASNISYRVLTAVQKRELAFNITYKKRWDAHDPTTCGRTGCQGKTWPTPPRGGH